MSIINDQIDSSWEKINYPVGLPGQGILSIQTWEQLAQELALRYQQQIKPHNTYPGNDREVAHYDEFNQLWPQYQNFEYVTNSLGFRDTEPMEQVDSCYYGCSMTYGEGVPYEGRWTHQLDQILSTTSNNFGIGGTSAEECMMLFMATSKLVKMKRAVFLFPDFHRKTICVSAQNNILDCMYFPLLGIPNWHQPRQLDKYIRNIRDTHSAHYRLPGVHMMDMFRTHVQTILYIAEQRGIEVVMSTWNDNTAQVLRHMKETNPALKIAKWTPMIDEGRDKHHPGIVTQAHWAREFAEVI